MDDFDSFDVESESLQADVMRFLAIIAFSLLVVFIPLIQIASNQPQKDNHNTTQIDEEKDVNIDIKPPPITQKIIPKKIIPKKSIPKKHERTIHNKSEILEKPEKKVNIVQKKNEPKPKTRTILFKTGSFESLISRGSIKGYVILIEHNVFFEFTYDTDNEMYVFYKVSIPTEDIQYMKRLKTHTLPDRLMPEFKAHYPELSLENYEFYFIPYGRLRQAFQRMKMNTLYGRFIITAKEQIIHEKQ